MTVLLAALALVQSAPSGSASAPDLRAILTVPREDPGKLQALWAFGQCAAERDVARAIAFLKGGQFAKPNDPAVRALVTANDECVPEGTALTFNQVYFAGAAAETIYRLNGFRFADHPVSMSAVNSLAALGSKSVVGGACVASLQPQQVDALFTTAVASAAEARVVMSMHQSVATCLPQVKRTPEMIRAVIAAGAFPAVASVVLGMAPSGNQSADAVAFERSEAFAKCAVGRASRTIARGFAENWVPENFTVALSRTTTEKCMRDMPSFAVNSPDLRYVLAREWLKSSKKLLKSNDFSAIPPLSHVLVHMPILRRVLPGEPANRVDAQSPDFNERNEQFSAIGECIVRGDTKRVEQFLNADGRVGPTGTIVPLLQRCVPVNTQVRISPAELTGLIALSYARLVAAADGTSQSQEAAE